MQEVYTSMENQIKRANTVCYSLIQNENFNYIINNPVSYTHLDVYKRQEYSIIPDQIAAGTFMCAAVATKGDITVKNVIPKHLESITAKRCV